MSQIPSGARAVVIDTGIHGPSGGRHPALAPVATP